MTSRQKLAVAAAALFMLSLFLNAAGSQSIEWGIADEGAYEKLAGEIQRQGSFWEFPAYYLGGQFTETFRGPLYVWLLSPIHDGQGLNRGLARAINTVLGAMAAVIVFLLVSRLWEPAIGLGAGVIAAVSNCTTLYGGIVAVEPLMMIGALLAWYCCLKALQDSNMEARHLVAALGLSAIAYYLKAHAFFFAPALLLTGIITSRMAFLRKRSLWLGLILMVLLLSFNVVRNMRAFGKPFYSEASIELWLDDASDSDEPGWQKKYGPVQYFRTHTPGQFAQRMVNGMILQITTIAHDLLGPTRISNALGRVSMLIGSILFVAFLAGLAKEPNPRWLIFHLIIVGMYALMFALRSGTMDAMYARWYLPLMGMFGAYSAIGLRDLWAGLGQRLPRARLRALRYVFLVGAVGYALITLRKIFTETGIAVWVVPD